jgi:arylsulfatase A-like enzyme
MLRKKHHKTYISIAIMLFVAAAAVIGTGCSSKPKKDYNVVLIVIDTLRSDHLPFYGYHRNTAPFLSDLVKQSAVFENSFAASSWTSPATASIFTSMYPYQHGVLMGLLAIRNAQKKDPTIKINRIPEEITTITEVMKQNGYQTYGIADNLNIDNRQGFTQGFDKFRTFMYRGAENVNTNVKKWHKKLTSNGKYFLYFHFMDPHAPYHTREPWFSNYYTPASGENQTDNPDGHNGNTGQTAVEEDEEEQSLSPAIQERRRRRIASYDSEINYADQHIKEMFQLFKWDQNTIVIVTADHGEGLWDHGLMGHGKTLHREEIQVPLIIFHPENKKPVRVSTNVTTMDILPTVRDLLGLDEGKTDEGVSLVPLMEGDESRTEELEKRDLFSYLWVKTSDKVEWRSTVYRNWHFMNRLPNGYHLYSLKSDKKEQNNLFSSGKKTALELEKRFDRFFEECRKFKPKTSDYKMDKKKTDKLKSLGYVQ